MIGESEFNIYHGLGNPRNSEGSFVTLNDGRVMFAYTRFNGNDWADHADADIVARYSEDFGMTWNAKDDIVLSNEGKCMIGSVSLLRLADGRIALFYSRKNNCNDCRCFMRTSDNECKTWSKPTCCVAGAGYYVVNNDRVIQLKNGRLIIPAAFHRNKIAPTRNNIGEIDIRGIAIFFYSDDTGKTWSQLHDWWTTPISCHSGLQEPGVIELKRNKLYAWARTDTGCQWEMWGRNSGDQILPPQQSNFETQVKVVSPLSMKRIPQTGDIIAIWCDANRRWNTDNTVNNKRTKYINESWGRTPLACAISSDEGKTWKRHKQIETDPMRGFCYTAIHFVPDAVLLAYNCGGKYPDGHTSIVLQDLCIRRINLEWFYS